MATHRRRSRSSAHLRRLASAPPAGIRLGHGGGRAAPASKGTCSSHLVSLHGRRNPERCAHALNAPPPVLRPREGCQHAEVAVDPRAPCDACHLVSPPMAPRERATAAVMRSGAKAKRIDPSIRLPSIRLRRGRASPSTPMLTAVHCARCAIGRRRPRPSQEVPRTPYVANACTATVSETTSSPLLAPESRRRHRPRSSVASSPRGHSNGLGVLTNESTLNPGTLCLGMAIMPRHVTRRNEPSRASIEA